MQDMATNLVVCKTACNGDDDGNQAASVRICAALKDMLHDEVAERVPAKTVRV